MKLKWQQAPVKTQWGDEMVVASVAIDNDHTLSLYCERDQTPKVDAMFALAEQPAQQEPVALFKWLPEGATHIGRISVRTAAGGSLAMTTYAFKYDSEVLKVYVTDNDNEYPGWRDAKDCFFHLNFPVLPLYTSPPAQRPWVGLTDEEIVEISIKSQEGISPHDDTLRFARAIEAAHGITGEKNGTR